MSDTFVCYRSTIWWGIKNVAITLQRKILGLRRLGQRNNNGDQTGLQQALQGFQYLVSDFNGTPMKTCMLTKWVVSCQDCISTHPCVLTIHCGSRNGPSGLRLGVESVSSRSVAFALRAVEGMRVRTSRLPMKCGWTRLGPDSWRVRGRSSADLAALSTCQIGLERPQLNTQWGLQKEHKQCVTMRHMARYIDMHMVRNDVFLLTVN